MTHLQRQSGVTFIELIISIIVISIGVAGILLVMNRNTSSSADPMIRHQSIAIAEAYLDEVLAKSFADPGGPPETGRADWDDINDYVGLMNVGARDQNDNLITGLTNYTVAVTVLGESLGPLAGTIAVTDSSRITVTVTAPNGAITTLSGYRTNLF